MPDCFGIFFGKLLLGRLGRDPEFFKYVEGSVSSRLRARTEYAFTVLDPSENPYLSYILCGNFTRAEIRETDLSEGSPTAMALPRYLRPGVLPKVKEHLERLSLYQGTIESAARIGDGFDGYNLSDLFEYLSPERTAGVYRALVECSRRKARFAYWNMLVPRSCPKELEGKVRHLETLSRELYRRDKAFFYSAFIVDEAQ